MIVCEAWEGGHNGLCAQALKDSRKMALHEAMFGYLGELGAPADRLAAVQARWESLLSGPPELAMLHNRDVADELRPLAQAAALIAESRTEGSDPLLPVVVDHLLTTSTRAHDPLADAGLGQRVSELA